MDATPKRRPGRPTAGGTPPARAIRVPDDLWEAARKVAADDGETLPEVIRRFLVSYVRRRQRKAGAGT
jgi:hypothetical protein